MLIGPAAAGGAEPGVPRKRLPIPATMAPLAPYILFGYRPKMPSLLFRFAMVLVLLTVLLGTVGLWLDEGVPHEMKVRLTVLNALAWVVIVLPALGVAMWARARRR